jgi:ketosteroid isomerase-like protein
MDREAIKTLIERAYEARRTDDIETILTLFHPDSKFAIAGSKEVTTAARAVQGHQQLRTTFAELIANFQFVQRDILGVLIDGDRAAVHSRVMLRFVPKDKMATTDLLDLWKIKDGKIVELVEFADTALVNNLMR